ncbi:MAG TPA: glycosyltransferase, partial [Bacteroidia bacterium]
QFGMDSFISAVSELIAEENSIHLSFVGNVDPALAKELKSKIPGVEFKGYVSHKESIAFAAKADLLLLVIPEGENQGTIPGKTFEYLSTQNPILCLTPPNGNAARIIEECEAGIGIEHHDKERMKKYITDLYLKWKKNESVKVNNTNFKKYSRKETTRQLAEIISNFK